MVDSKIFTVAGVWDPEGQWEVENSTRRVSISLDDAAMQEAISKGYRVCVGRSLYEAEVLQDAVDGSIVHMLFKVSGRRL